MALVEAGELRERIDRALQGLAGTTAARALVLFDAEGFFPRKIAEMLGIRREPCDRMSFMRGEPCAHDWDLEPRGDS